MKPRLFHTVDFESHISVNVMSLDKRPRRTHAPLDIIHEKAFNWSVFDPDSSELTVNFCSSGPVSSNQSVENDVFFDLVDIVLIELTLQGFSKVLRALPLEISTTTRERHR